MIRGFRQANFKLLIVALILIVYFALDHVHYSHWVSVFTQQLFTLPQRFPTLYENFAASYFVVNSKGNTFSKIAGDHVQGINNNRKFNHFVAISIRSILTTRALKLELSLSKIDQYLIEMEDPSVLNNKNKESLEPFTKRFKNGCRKVSWKIITNPFSNP